MRNKHKQMPFLMIGSPFICMFNKSNSMAGAVQVQEICMNSLVIFGILFKKYIKYVVIIVLFFLH